MYFGTSLTINPASRMMKGGRRLWDIVGTCKAFLKTSRYVFCVAGQSYATAPSTIGTLVDFPNAGSKGNTSQVLSLTLSKMYAWSHKTIMFAWLSSSVRGRGPIL